MIETRGSTADLPSPPILPVFQAIRAGLDPEGYFVARQKKEGDFFCIRLPGVGKIYVTGSPAGAKEVYLAPREHFAGFRSNVLEPLVGSRSVMVLDEQEHSRERQLMSPAFQGDRVQVYGDLIHKVVLDEVRQWSEAPQFVAIKSMRKITLQVIIRAVFGVQGSERQRLFSEVIGRFLDNYTPALLLLPFLRKSFGGRGPWARFESARKEFDRLLQEEIELRRASRSPAGNKVGESPSGGPGDSSESDVLSVLLRSKDDAGVGINDSDLRDELRTLLVAGHETSATAITWGLYFLHRDAKILDRVKEELAAFPKGPSPQELTELPYLAAVCNEALRIHPVVPITLRKLKKSLQVQGRLVPAGEHVAVSITLVHRHLGTWNDPESFDPERFLGRKYSPFEFIPFGGGHRRCLGASLANFEMKVVLGTILAHADLALLDPKTMVRPVTHNITTGPSGGIPMRLMGLRNL